MICVAGMPRSGTSLVTRLLHRCGVDLGPPEQMMPASPNNTEGYWENLLFVGINERLLASSGGTWFAPPATLRPTSSIVAEARAAIAQFEGREPWAWKDPRNALTLPFWKSLLPSMKVVVCLRHPEETAASLVASTLIPRSWPFSWSVSRPDSPIRLRDDPSGLPRRILHAARTSLSGTRRRALVHEAGLELWRISNTKILEETREGERVVVHYEALLSNPRAELERILSFAGLDVAPEVLEEAARIASPRMRHQLASGAGLPPEVGALYARLSREAAAAL
jgi:hypothetical protein